MSKTTAGGKKRIIFLLRDPFEHKYRVISSDKDIAIRGPRFVVNINPRIEIIVNK